MVSSAIWKKNMHEFSKDYQNCTSPKDECNLKSLKNSRVYVFLQIARETILLLLIICMKKLCSYVRKSHLEIKKYEKLRKLRNFFFFALLLANRIEKFFMYSIY
jgi:hypothetical protein